MPAETVVDRLRAIHREERERSAAGSPGTVRAPLGSNNVKYNTWFYGRKVRGPQFMWCAVYQAWAAAKCGIPMSIYPKAASVPVVRDFFQERGRLFQKPMVGDLVIFIFSATARHIGFVETLLDDGRFTSIEGNVSSRVMRVNHRVGDRGIVGFGRPEYDKIEEDDVTKEELRDMLRSALSPGFTTVNEWASQLNDVKRDVEAIKQDVEAIKNRLQ
jgi:hypothetical protein